MKILKKYIEKKTKIYVNEFFGRFMNIKLKTINDLF